MILRQRKYREAVKDQGKMYTEHTSTLLFKDKRLRNQVPTLTCTSYHFHSSWSSGPKHISRMRMGPSLQRKGPGSGTPLLQTSSRKSPMLSNLILAPCYLLVPGNRLLLSFNVQTSGRKDSDIIGVRGYICRKRNSKRNATQDLTSILVIKLTEQGL